MSNLETSSDFIAFLSASQERINLALATHLGSFQSPFSPTNSEQPLARLQQSMHYSLINGGKRVRPVLVYAAAQAVNPDLLPAIDQDLDRAAAALEMIHAYSLIHDDLPAMDDDDLRRGQPTCHRAFDEATAILAGDALQTRAFELLTELEQSDAEARLQLVRLLAQAAGQRGMVGGQVIDLNAVDQQIALEHLETIHRLKTGALIRAAVQMGATIALADETTCKLLDSYAESIGLAFQVKDDILDIESDTATLGKTQGADQALNKPTYPSLLGLEGAKAKADELHQTALSALAGLGDSAEQLRALSHYIINRSH